MGGSGGRGFFRGRKPEEIKLDLRKEEEKTLDQAFDAQVAEHLGKFLSEANQRDTEAIRDALDEIKNALGADIEGTVDPILGGSIRKRTYVDGISDIDTLLILRDPKLNPCHRSKCLRILSKKPARNCPAGRVSRGNLAITLRKEGHGDSGSTRRARRR